MGISFLALRDDPCQRGEELHNSQQPQNDKDDGDHDQGMDPTARPRETWIDIRSQKAEQPQDD